MNHINRLFTLFFMIGSCISLQSMQRTTASLAKSAGTETTTKYILKLTPEKLKLYQATLKNYKNAVGKPFYKVYNTYSDVFYHPLYTNWFEPLYVGNKAEIWGHQFADLYKNPSKFYTNFNEKRAHKQFNKMIYQRWKDHLTAEELFKHQEAIQAYENAYEHYLITPTNSDIEKELLHQTERIYQTLHDHPASMPIEPTKNLFEFEY